MPEPNEKPPETLPEKPPEKLPEKPPERVPEYIERHELKSALDELRQLWTDRGSKDDARLTAIESSITDMRKPKPKPDLEPDQKQGEKGQNDGTPEEKSKRRKLKLWRTL